MRTGVEIVEILSKEFVDKCMKTQLPIKTYDKTSYQVIENTNGRTYKILFSFPYNEVDEKYFEGMNRVFYIALLQDDRSGEYVVAKHVEVNSWGNGSYFMDNYDKAYKFFNEEIVDYNHNSLHN